MIAFLYHALAHFAHHYHVERLLAFGLPPLIAAFVDIIVVCLIYFPTRKDCLHIDKLLETTWWESESGGIRFAVDYSCLSDYRIGWKYKKGSFIAIALRPPFFEDFWVCQFIFHPRSLSRPVPQ